MTAVLDFKAIQAAPGCLEGGEGVREATERDRILRITGRAGDLKVTWDPSNATEVDYADSIFQSAKARGMGAFTIHTDASKESEMIRDLQADKPAAEVAPEVVAIPALQGG
jgi:hypothetical protein